MLLLLPLAHPPSGSIPSWSPSLCPSGSGHYSTAMQTLVGSVCVCVCGQFIHPAANRPDWIMATLVFTSFSLFYPSLSTKPCSTLPSKRGIPVSYIPLCPPNEEAKRKTKETKERGTFPPGARPPLLAFASTRVSTARITKRHPSFQQERECRRCCPLGRTSRRKGPGCFHPQAFHTSLHGHCVFACRA